MIRHATARLRILFVTLIVVALTACGSTPQAENRAPRADAGPDLDAVVGETVTLDGSASDDPDGAALEFSWRLVSRPEDSRATLEDAEAPVATLTPDVEGTYEIGLTVRDGRGSATDSTVLSVAPAGVERFDAAPEARAADVVFDLHVPLRDSARFIERDPGVGADVLRTEIEIEFVDDATVEHVNAVLEAIDGRVVSMVRNTPILIVEIPDPGDLASLEAVLDQVGAFEAVGSVDKTVVAPVPRTDVEEREASELGFDTQATPSLAQPARIDHHVAVRAHAAWNVRAALPPLAERPTFLIGDFFGDGEPQDGYDIRSSADDYGDDLSNRHGYHVLGIATGSYGPGASTARRSDVTGLFPGTLEVAAVDINDRTLLTGRTRNRLVQRMNDLVAADPDARIVVNTSLGSDDPGLNQNRPARKYIKQIRNNGLEERVVHVTSAGNADGTPLAPVTWPAAWNSGYACAALGLVTRINGATVDNLTNMLVVENRVNTPAATSQRPLPGCAHGDSIVGGQISAVGTSVWSFGRRLRDPILGTVIGTDSQGASSATGTSMAAPQVAALAAYVWALDPTLTGPEVVDLLIRTSRDDYNATATGNASPAWGCNATAPAPVIDAFDAVLAAGGVSAQTALADVTDAGGSGRADGVFDEHDIEAFLGAWTSAPTLDYSRFDLNGDGLAEGAVASAFPERVDLDGDGTVGTATVDWLGVSVTVDETAVTDLQILCHLAYGPAYAGDAFARNRLLGQPCGLIDVDIVNPDDGDAFPEGETIAFLIDASIASPHDGDIVLRSGGAERDRYRGYSHLDDFTITTLSTREVCPSDPVVKVAFEDAVTGLRATDRVTLDITANGLSVSIAGGDPRWVRAKRDTATGELFHEPISLAGKASVPSCTDPFSERIDQSTLEWRGGGTVLGNGPTLGLPGDYLRAVGIPGKEFFARSVELIYAFEGATDSDRVRLEPCTSSLGLGPTEATVEDVPECPLQGVIGSLVEQLRDTFGSVDPADTEEIVGRIIHGVPDYRAVLEELGSEPCDPRFCDPFPPDFPRSQGELSGSFYGDRGLATSGFLDRLFEALAQPGVEAFDAELDGLLRDVAASSELSDADRELIAASAGVALGVVDVVARLELDGRDPWRAFGFAGDPEALAGRVDTLEPAAKGVQGFLTAVVVERVNSGFDAELHLDAAAYAASLAAFQEARKAARE